MREIAVVLFLVVPLSAWAQSKWEYRDASDRMSGRVIHSASVLGADVATMGKSNGGPQAATLTLRSSDGESGDAMISFPRAGIVCAAEGCSVPLSFDGGRARRCPIWKPGDGPRKLIFLQCRDLLVKKLRTAKKLRMDMNFHNEGSHLVEFDVSGLILPRPPKR